MVWELGLVFVSCVPCSVLHKPFASCLFIAGGGYPFGLTMIALSALIPLIWFKWRGWF